MNASHTRACPGVCGARPLAFQPDGEPGIGKSRHEAGETIRLGFSVATAPFDLRLEQSDDRTVAWRTETFPPHWVGTTIGWDVEAPDYGSSVSFRHRRLQRRNGGHAVFAWGQIMVQRKSFAETGNLAPVFS